MSITSREMQIEAQPYASQSGYYHTPKQEMLEKTWG